MTNFDRWLSEHIAAWKADGKSGRDLAVLGIMFVLVVVVGTYWVRSF